MSKATWVFLGVFFFGLGCVAAGVLLIPDRTPEEVLAGAPPPEDPPLAAALIMGGLVLTMVGLQSGLGPILPRLPGWALILILISPVAIFLAFMIFFHGH